MSHFAFFSEKVYLIKYRKKEGEEDRETNLDTNHKSKEDKLHFREEKKIILYFTIRSNI